jgi:hypothetical protein
MKTKLFLMLTISVAGILILPGCAKKQGCTNATATNYDADAEEDDGSCTYGADVFVGNYSGTETITRQSDGSLVEVRSESFSIQKTDETTINFVSFFGCTTVTGNVSNLSFIGTFCFGAPLYDLVGTLENNNLTYTFTNSQYLYQGNVIAVIHTGAATKL